MTEKVEQSDIEVWIRNEAMRVGIGDCDNCSPGSYDNPPEMCNSCQARYDELVKHYHDTWSDD